MAASNIRDEFEEWAHTDSRHLEPLQHEERTDDNFLYYVHDCDNQAYTGWYYAKHTFDPLRYEMISALSHALISMETGIKIRDPDWDGTATGGAIREVRDVLLKAQERGQL